MTRLDEMLETMAEEIGEMFAEERQKIRDELAALRMRIAALEGEDGHLRKTFRAAAEREPAHD
jgi:hypothetical protein